MEELIIKAILLSNEEVRKNISRIVSDRDVIKKYAEVLDWDILSSRSDISPRVDFLEENKDRINWKLFYPKSEEEYEKFEDYIDDRVWISLGGTISREWKDRKVVYKYFNRYENKHPLIWKKSSFNLPEDYDFLLSKKENYIGGFLQINKSFLEDPESLNRLEKLLLDSSPDLGIAIFRNYDTVRNILKLENEDLKLQYIKLLISKDKDWGFNLFIHFQENALELLPKLDKTMEIPYQNLIGIINPVHIVELEKKGLFKNIENIDKLFCFPSYIIHTKWNDKEYRDVFNFIKQHLDLIENSTIFLRDLESTSYLCRNLRYLEDTDRFIDSVELLFPKKKRYREVSFINKIKAWLWRKKKI